MSAATVLNTLVPANNSQVQLNALAANGQLQGELPTPAQAAGTLIDVNGNVVVQVGTDQGLYQPDGVSLIGGAQAVAGTANFPAASSSSAVLIQCGIGAKQFHAITVPASALAIRLVGSLPGMTGDIVVTNPTGAPQVVTAYAPSGSGSSTWLQPSGTGSNGIIPVTGSSKVDLLSWRNLAGTIYASIGKFES